MDQEENAELKDHTVIATLLISGEEVKIGYLKGVIEDTPFFQTSENAEPIYGTCHEFEMLVAAMRNVINEVRGEPRQ